MKQHITWKEAIRLASETRRKIEEEIQAGFEAEAKYWQGLDDDPPETPPESEARA